MGYADTNSGHHNNSLRDRNNDHNDYDHYDHDNNNDYYHHNNYCDNYRSADADNVRYDSKQCLGSDPDDQSIAEYYRCYPKDCCGDRSQQDHWHVGECRIL